MSPAHPDGLVDGFYPVLDVAALLVVVNALLLLHRAEGRHVGLVAVCPVPESFFVLSCTKNYKLLAFACKYYRIMKEKSCKVL